MNRTESIPGERGEREYFIYQVLVLCLSIFKSAKILKLVDLHKHEFYLQSWKFFQQKLPESIDTNLERRINNINLRYDTSLLKPRVLHNTDNHQYDINLIKNINTLDPALRHIININKAKKHSKICCLININP